MTKSVAEIARIWVGSYLLDSTPDPHFAELFAPRVKAWHNYDAERVEYNGHELANLMLQRREQLRRVMPDFRVEDFKLYVAEFAFIFTHTVNRRAILTRFGV